MGGNAVPLNSIAFSSRKSSPDTSNHSPGFGSIGCQLCQTDSVGCESNLEVDLYSKIHLTLFVEAETTSHSQQTIRMMLTTSASVESDLLDGSVQTYPSIDLIGWTDSV